MEIGDYTKQENVKATDGELQVLRYVEENQEIRKLKNNRVKWSNSLEFKVYIKNIIT